MLAVHDVFRPEKPYGLQGTGAGGGAGNESLGPLACLHSSELGFLAFFLLLFIFPILLIVPFLFLVFFFLSFFFSFLFSSRK